MLECQRNGVPYVKRRVNAWVQSKTGRSAGAIEFKFANFSAVLCDLELEYVEGYLPRSHYQVAMRNLVEMRLAGGSDVFPPTSLYDVPIDRNAEPSEMELTQLLKRSFGGGNVAIGQQPDVEDWPLAPPAAGAAEASRLFLEDLQASDGDLSWLVFLGGPGNGKSALAREIQNSPGLNIPDGEMPSGHRRSMDLRHDSGRQVRIVNDATIRTGGASLITDLSAARNDQMHLVLNVNRGVLVEDLQNDSSCSIESLEGWIINFLLYPDTTRELDGYEIYPLGGDQSPYAEQIEIRSQLCSIHLRVVRLDVCSLFEPRPMTSIEGGRLKAGRYRVTRLNERVNADLGSIPALELIRRTLEVLPQCGFDDPRFDAIGANIATLRSPSVLSGVGTIFRSAEIVESRLFTFREVWGAISLLVLGPLTPDDADFGRFSVLYGEAVAVHSESESSPKKRLQSLLPLTNFRFTQALFFEPRVNLVGVAPGSSRDTPVTKRMRAVDPARDAIPGNSLDLTSGWASPVLEALEEAQFGGSPISRIASGDPIFDGAVTDFDRNLETAVLDYCRDSKTRDGDHDAVMSWFGRYLLRLYGVIHGIPAFSEVLLSWTRGWNQAHVNGSLGDHLGASVKMLLVPSFSASYAGGEVLVLPAFAPQTVPLLSGPQSPVAVARFSSNLLSISAHTLGDRLKVDLRNENEVLLTIDFDFPLVREALTSARGFTGATELGARSTPKLERARAALLSSKNSAGNWGTALGDSLTAFSVASEE